MCWSTIVVKEKSKEQIKLIQVVRDDASNTYQTINFDQINIYGWKTYQNLFQRKW